MDCIGGLGKKDGISDLLVHYFVDTTDYESYTLKFASNQVASELAARFQINKRSQLLSFVQASETICKMSTLRGHLFEGMCHNMLTTPGLTFKARLLESGYFYDTVSRLTFGRDWIYTVPRNQVVVSFANHQAIPGLANYVYARPISKTLPVADSIVKPFIIFQMTVNKSHGIKRQRLIDLVNAMGAVGGTVRFYWVVPDSIYETYPKQRLTVDINDDPHQQQTIAEANIEQWVLKIQLAQF